jgi:hypothetical protein
MQTVPRDLRRGQCSLAALGQRPSTLRTLPCVASHGQDDHSGATARRGGVDRSDVDPLLRQPGCEPSECARLVPEASLERRLFADPVLGLAKRALGPDGVVDEQPDLLAAGCLRGAGCRDVDAGLRERAGRRARARTCTPCKLAESCGSHRLRSPAGPLTSCLKDPAPTIQSPS